MSRVSKTIFNTGVSSIHPTLTSNHRNVVFAMMSADCYSVQQVWTGRMLSKLLFVCVLHQQHQSAFILVFAENFVMAWYRQNLTISLDFFIEMKP
jgi:hypothetical protein